MQEDRSQLNHSLATCQGAISIGINILLFASKYWVGLATGSVALVVDAWHLLQE